MLNKTVKYGESLEHYYYAKLNLLNRCKIYGRPGSGGTDGISKFRTPKSRHELGQFLGVSRFFRRFIKNYAVLAAPLTDLLGRDATWVWDGAGEEMFGSVGSLLTQRPLLSACAH